MKYECYDSVCVYRLEKEYTALKSKENEDQIELRVSCYYMLSNKRTKELRVHK